MYKEYERKITNQSLSNVGKHKNKIIIACIIVGAILVAGYLFSGGTRPNSNISGVGSIFDPLPAYQTGLGAINGYVSGPVGLPAVGATVVAAEQGGSYNTVTAFISVDGKYVLSNLEPGTYNLVVAFPDGTNKVLNNIHIEAGSVQTINTKY
jgi:hypothetical protein